MQFAFAKVQDKTTRLTKFVLVNWVRRAGLQDGMALRRQPLKHTKLCYHTADSDYSAEDPSPWAQRTASRSTLATSAGSYQGE